MRKFVDSKKLQYLCKLAKIEISKEEEEHYLDLLNNDLESLEILDDIDVNSLTPITNPYEMVLTEYPDVVSDGNKVNELMKCAPKELYNYFVVPKVMEKQ